MGRRNYPSQAEWSALIEQQSQNGLSVAEFYKRHGLVVKCFYRKRRQLSDGKAFSRHVGALKKYCGPGDWSCWKKQ